MGESDDRPWSPERTVVVSEFDIDSELVTRFDFLSWLNELEVNNSITYETGTNLVYLADNTNAYDGMVIWDDYNSWYFDDGDSETDNFDVGATDDEQ